MIEPNRNPTPENPRRYKWPWFVLAMFILGVVLAVVWMTAEIRRQQSYRQLDTPLFPQGASTNTSK